MLDRLRMLNLASAVLAIVGTTLLSYSLLWPYEGREYGDVTADGSVSRLPGYVSWQKRSDRLGRLGLALVMLSAGMQIALVFVPAPRE